MFVLKQVINLRQAMLVVISYDQVCLSYVVASVPKPVSHRIGACDLRGTHATILTSGHVCIDGARVQKVNLAGAELGGLDIGHHQMLVSATNHVLTECLGHSQRGVDVVP